MRKQLSLSARPKTFDCLIGQQHIVKIIRKGIKKCVPKGFLFCGPKGVGKTTIARIIALSLQCTHQDRFGAPCIDCRKNATNFPIYEINCARVRGVEDLEEFIHGSDYEILGKGRRKVFILDECHMLSKHAQDLLLVPLEDMSSKSVWIICSTRPDKISETVRSRCQTYILKPLKRDDTLLLVTSLLKKVASELSPDELTESLVENTVDSARLIAQAVERYVAGASAEEAADVNGATEISSKSLCRAVVKGDWDATSSLLKKSSSADVRALRAAVIGYLRVVLLESVEINARANAVADSIKRLSYVGSAEDVNQMGALVAELYGLCQIFAEYSL